MRTFAAEPELNPFEEIEKAGKAHEPLIQLFGTPAKFATAAYRQASQKNELDQVEKDLTVRYNFISISSFRNYLPKAVPYIRPRQTVSN